jgi:alpha-mannosidase
MIRMAKGFSRLLVVTLLAWPGAVLGQQAASVNPAIGSVTSRLRTLTRLPAEEWRYHEGDLAHGEAIDLDDKDWSVAQKDSYAPVGAVWYRRWVEVPPTLNGYDLTGTKLWFKFSASANGPIPEIVYFNGRRVAMGEDLEPIILLDPVKPGDKVLIAVKLLQTIDKKHFEDAVVRVDFSATRPNPLDLLQEIESTTALAPSIGAQ